MNASRELVVRGAQAHGFAHRELEHVANPQWRRKREGSRAALSDGVDVERNLHADHYAINFCRIEDLPAGRDK